MAQVQYISPLCFERKLCMALIILFLTRSQGALGTKNLKLESCQGLMNYQQVQVKVKVSPQGLDLRRPLGVENKTLDRVANLGEIDL